jgi:tetratricopeptide (TPR) repeat protein
MMGNRDNFMARALVNIAAIGILLGLVLGPLSPLTTAQTIDEESLFTIAVRAYQDGLYDLARDQLQTYLTTFPHGKHGADVQYLLGDYFYRQGDFAAAAQHLQEALQLHLSPNLRDDARYLLGRSRIETARYSEAVQALQPLIEQGRSGRWYEAALYWSGEAQLSQSDAAGAADLLTQLVEQFPASDYLAHALYSLGYARQKMADHEGGLEPLQRLLREFPRSPLRSAAEYGVARALVALQRFEEAVPYWERLHQQAESPERAAEAAFWAAESWARAKRCDQASVAFEAYLGSFPLGEHRADALVNLGECALKASDLATASRHVEVFVQQFPADERRDPLLLHLADAYSQTGQVVPAIQGYSRWLAAFPNNPQGTDVLLRRGLLYYMQADYGQAVQDFSEVLRRTPAPQQQAMAHRMSAESYWHLDDCAAAVPHLTAVIAQGSDVERRLARWRRGICAYRNQQLTAAVEDFSRLGDDAEFGGDRQRLLLLLGQSLAALERDAEAIVRLQQLLADEPADDVRPQALATLGASLVKVGQASQALAVYEQLLSLVPDLPGNEHLHLHLARLYRAQQEPDRARAHLEVAANGQDTAIVPEALYYLADLVLESGTKAEGLALLQKVTRPHAGQNRWVGIAHYRLALLYEDEQQWPEAWQAYEDAAAAATDPKLAEAARGRARHLEETVDVQTRRESSAMDDEPRTPSHHQATQP